MECSLTDNPLVKTYIIKMPLLHAILIADQIRDWTESVIDCETTNIELSRKEIGPKHFIVESGSSLKVSFNTCHDKYDTEQVFVDGVVQGAEFLINCIPNE